MNSCVPYIIMFYKLYSTADSYNKICTGTCCKSYSPLPKIIEPLFYSMDLQITKCHPLNKLIQKQFHIPTNLHESYSGYILTQWNSNKPASFRNRQSMLSTKRGKFSGMYSVALDTPRTSSCKKTFTDFYSQITLLILV